MPPPGSNSDTLTGVVERIIFFNEENHYTIAEFRPDNDRGPKDSKAARPEPVTIVGTLPGVECGETLHLQGEWTRHAQHGAQFKIASFKSELPASVYGIRKYLGSGLVPGIGKVYANKIVDVFGTDTFRVLSEESARLREVEGIGAKRATAIKKAWDEKRTERELYIFLQTYGVTPSQCVKLVKKYGAQAKTILTTEPYRVAREIDGIGFKTADRIAINLGFANDAPPRLDAGILFALETLQEEGHTAFGEADLRDYTANLLETDSKRVEARIAALIEAKALVRHGPSGISNFKSQISDPHPAGISNFKSEISNPRPAPAGADLKSSPAAGSSPLASRLSPLASNLVQLPHNDRAEQKIASTITRLLRVASGLPPIKVDAAVEWAEKKAGFAFADLQRTALKHALTHKISILTGGPGTGKAQPLHSQVLTPLGFRAIGQLRSGDEVISAEGTVARIRSVHPQGVKPTFRVTFSDGRSCECCGDHLWKVWTRTSVWSPAKKKKIRARGWRVVPLSYISGRIANGRTESERIAVPLLTPWQGTDLPLEIPPYVLGALIGDGDLTRAVHLTTTDAELHARVASLAEPMGVRLKQVTLHGEPTITYRLIARGKGYANPLRDAIVRLGLNVTCESKFIPAGLFNASLEQRIELIRGLLDTDGTVDRLGVVSFTTCSYQLALDFQKLAWSIGAIATLGATRHPHFSYRGERQVGREAYTVFLQHPEPATLFHLARKQRRTARPRARHRLSYRLRVASISPLGPQECVCISLDSASGLYVTDGYVVTHNTTILRALVEILKAKKVRVHLAAPTGRAAQRLAETTGGYASTIHRLLKYDAAQGGFTANENAPLATDYLVIDEASMLDTRLAAALVQAVPSRAHLLLVGDTDQLPSVGAGNVLKDLIAVSGRLSPADLKSQISNFKSANSDSGSQISNFRSQISNAALPVTRLSVIFRQQGQSQIVTTAHAINDGDPSLPPILHEVSQSQVWADLNFIAAADATDCVNKVIELLTRFIPQSLKWPHPVRDVQVLAPMHKGIAGVANLNVQLQGALNPHARGLRGPGGEYRPGDKVIQLRNNYDKNLFNGDIGTVVSIDAEAGTLDAEFDGERHTFDRGEFADLALAYAISIHKSQGSEYPVVIVPLLKAHFMMLQRNLIYTAITRGKKKVFIVGEPVAYAMAVRNSEAKQRLTHLKEKLTGFRDAKT